MSNDIIVEQIENVIAYITDKITEIEDEEFIETLENIKDDLNETLEMF